MRRNLETIKKYYFYSLIIFFSWLIPKKKGYYLIDYGILRGNIECFHEISFKNDSIDRRIGIYKPWLKNLHINSLKLLRCEYLIIDSEPSFLGVRFMRLFMNLFFIDLWHATGLKKIKLQSGRMRKGFIQELSLGLRRYVCASSPNDALLKSQGYGKFSKILLIGSVQVDDLFKQENQIFKRTNTILYAPTFNDITKEYADDRIINSLIFINRILKDNNWRMVIKPHPVSKYKWDLRKYENIEIFKDKEKRTNEILRNYDLLISDNSGIMTDFMLTGKPIIKLIPKIEDRAMFYEEVIFKEISVKSKNQLLKRIEEIIKKKSAYKKFSKVSKEMSSNFHSFRTFGNSQRIIDGIKKGNLKKYLFSSNR